MKKHLKLNSDFLNHLKLIFSRDDINDLVGNSEKHIYFILDSFNEIMQSNEDIDFSYIKKALFILSPSSNCFNEKNNDYFNYLSPAFNSQTFKKFIYEELNNFESSLSDKVIQGEISVDLRYIDNLLFFLNFSDEEFQKEVFYKLNKKYLINIKSVFSLRENKRKFLIKNITDEKTIEDIASKTLTSLFKYDFNLYKDHFYEGTLKAIISDLKLVKNKAVLKNKELEKFFTLILNHSCGKDDDLFFSCLNKDKIVQYLKKKKNIYVESYDHKLYIERKIKEYFDLQTTLLFHKIELHNFNFEDQIFIIKFSQQSKNNAADLNLKVEWFISDIKANNGAELKDGFYRISKDYKELTELKYTH
jgi:hypothetical protein